MYAPRKLDLRAAADGNVHVSLMRRAASAAGDNSKITGLHADALRARCEAVHGTACIQIVSCPAPRGLHIVRDREIMPVGIYPADGIGDVLQCEITIQRQREPDSLYLVSPAERMVHGTDGIVLAEDSSHVIVEFDRAAVCRVHRGNSVSPALIVLPVHGKGVFLDTLEERQVLANDTGPFAVLFRRRADTTFRLQCPRWTPRADFRTLCRFWSGRRASNRSGYCCYPRYSRSPAPSVGRGKRYRYLIRIRVGGFSGDTESVGLKPSAPDSVPPARLRGQLGSLARAPRSAQRLRWSARDKCG